MLMVAIFMGILAIIGLSACKSSVFLQQFAFAREHLIIRETLTKSLLNYGIALAQADFDEMCKNERTKKIEFRIDQDSIGRIILSGTTHSMELVAQLEQKGAPIYGASCSIRKNSEQKLAIEGFQSNGFPL